jgi:hypothetical protein
MSEFHLINRLFCLKITKAAQKKTATFSHENNKHAKGLSTKNGDNPVDFQK